MFNWPISVLGDWNDIYIAHVIIIIKSEVSTFPIVIIIFRGSVPEMFVTSSSVTYCIYVPGKLRICFHYYCAVHDECKYSDTFRPADRTLLFVQYTISLSSLCKLIWRHWTYKIPVRYILSSVWVRWSIFSPLSILQYVGCMFSVYPFLLWWLREYIYFVLLSSSNGSMNYYPLFRVRSWNNGVRCMSFYILNDLVANWSMWNLMNILTLWIFGSSKSFRIKCEIWNLAIKTVVQLTVFELIND